MTSKSTKCFEVQTCNPMQTPCISCIPHPIIPPENWWQVRALLMHGPTVKTATIQWMNHRFAPQNFRCGYVWHPFLTLKTCDDPKLNPASTRATKTSCSQGDCCANFLRQVDPTPQKLVQIVGLGCENIQITLCPTIMEVKNGSLQ